jgi:hypothetical protein
VTSLHDGHFSELPFLIQHPRIARRSRRSAMYRMTVRATDVQRSDMATNPRWPFHCLLSPCKRSSSRRTV